MATAAVPPIEVLSMVLEERYWHSLYTGDYVEGQSPQRHFGRPFSQVSRRWREKDSANGLLQYHLDRARFKGISSLDVCLLDIPLAHSSDGEGVSNDVALKRARALLIAIVAYSLQSKWRSLPILTSSVSRLKILLLLLKDLQFDGLKHLSIELLQAPEEHRLPRGSIRAENFPQLARLRLHNLVFSNAGFRNKALSIIDLKVDNACTDFYYHSIFALAAAAGMSTSTILLEIGIKPRRSAHVRFQLFGLIRENQTLTHLTLNASAVRRLGYTAQFYRVRHLDLVVEAGQLAAGLNILGLAGGRHFLRALTMFPNLTSLRLDANAVHDPSSIWSEMFCRIRHVRSCTLTAEWSEWLPPLVPHSCSSALLLEPAAIVNWPKLDTSSVYGKHNIIIGGVLRLLATSKHEGVVVHMDNSTKRFIQRSLPAMMEKLSRNSSRC